MNEDGLMAGKASQRRRVGVLYRIFSYESLSVYLCDILQNSFHELLICVKFPRHILLSAPRLGTILDPE